MSRAKTPIGQQHVEQRLRHGLLGRGPGDGGHLGSEEPQHPEHRREHGRGRNRATRPTTHSGCSQVVSAPKTTRLPAENAMAIDFREFRRTRGPPGRDRLGHGSWYVAAGKRVRPGCHTVPERESGLSCPERGIVSSGLHALLTIRNLSRRGREGDRSMFSDSVFAAEDPNWPKNGPVPGPHFNADFEVRKVAGRQPCEDLPAVNPTAQFRVHGFQEAAKFLRRALGD